MAGKIGRRFNIFMCPFTKSTPKSRHLPLWKHKKKASSLQFRRTRKSLGVLVCLACILQLFWFGAAVLPQLYVWSQDEPAASKAASTWLSLLIGYVAVPAGGPKHELEKLCGVGVSAWLDFSVGCEEPPVMVVGCGHSGTSILLDLLGAHSAVHKIPFESGIILGDQISPCRTALAAAKFSLECARAGRLRWAEKTPKHITALSRLFDRLPNSRVVLILRDGRDVALSLFKRHRHICRAGNHSCERQVFMEKAVGRWVTDNAAGEPFWEDPRVLVVRYEELVEHPTETLRDIFSFTGLEQEDVVSQRERSLQRQPQRFRAVTRLSFDIGGIQDSTGEGVLAQAEGPESDPNHDAFRAEQLRQPLRRDMHGKWRTGLSAEQVGWFKQSKDAQAMLVRYGYAPIYDWGP